MILNIVGEKRSLHNVNQSILYGEHKHSSATACQSLEKKAL